MIRIESGNLKATIGDIEYTWSGGFGSIICSYERGVKKGDVRMIGDILFYVYMIEKHSYSKPPRISWTVADGTNAHLTTEFINEIRKAIFM